MRNNYKILPALFVLAMTILMLNACQSTRQTGKGGKSIEKEGNKLLETVIRKNPAIPSLSAKMRLTANINGKKMSVNANLKIQKDKLIRISIAPILGIEVARIEIAPEQALVLDRINQRYLRIPLSDLTARVNHELNFHALQALFCHNLFLSGVQEVTLSELNEFLVDPQPDGWIICPRKKKTADCLYTTNETGQITHTQFSYRQYVLGWNYAAFKQVDKVSFPMQMHIEAKSTDRIWGATLELSKAEIGKTSLSQTNIPERYKQLTAEQLFKMLTDL